MSEKENLKKNLKNLSDEDKRTVGALANKITQDLEEMLREKHDIFYQKELNEKRAAKEAEGTPIYGMPVLDADKAKHVIICNYDLKPGYAGVCVSGRDDRYGQPESRENCRRSERACE